MTLLELRDALKAATFPSPLLDMLIKIALVGEDDKKYAPRYTESIDAAVKLVPQGLCRLTAVSPTECIVNLMAKAVGEVDGQEWLAACRAPTLPLALCLAVVEHKIAQKEGA